MLRDANAHDFICSTLIDKKLHKQRCGTAKEGGGYIENRYLPQPSVASHRRRSWSGRPRRSGSTTTTAISEPDSFEIAHRPSMSSLLRDSPSKARNGTKRRGLGVPGGVGEGRRWPSGWPDNVRGHRGRIAGGRTETGDWLVRSTSSSSSSSEDPLSCSLIRGFSLLDALLARRSRLG